jgi:hypothetical protein
MEGPLDKVYRQRSVASVASPHEPDERRPLLGRRWLARRLHAHPLALGLLGWMLAAAGVVVLLHIANELTGANKRLFDLDKEQNLPTWLSSVQLFAAGLCAWLSSLRAPGRERLAWRGLAAILMFLSLDELALIHEEVVEQVTGDPTADPWWWPALYLPLGAALLAAFWVALWTVRDVLGSATAFVAGFALLGVSIALDTAATQYVDNRWLFSPSLVVEEALELCGSAVLVCVLLSVFLVRSGAERTRSVTGASEAA